MKYSRQREIILEMLNQNKVHPSAEQLYMMLKEKGENVSIATVYRNLNSLAETGEILKFKTFEKNERFDSTIKPHYHFQCEKCSKIYDLPVEITQRVKDNVSHSGFEVTKFTVMVSGICPNCKSEQKENE